MKTLPHVQTALDAVTLAKAALALAIEEATTAYTGNRTTMTALALSDLLMAKGDVNSAERLLRTAGQR